MDSKFKTKVVDRLSFSQIIFRQIERINNAVLYGREYYIACVNAMEDLCYPKIPKDIKDQFDEKEKRIAGMPSDRIHDRAGEEFAFAKWKYRLLITLLEEKGYLEVKDVEVEI